MLEKFVSRYGKQRYLAISLMVFFVADGLLPVDAATSKLVSYCVLGMLIVTGPLASARRSWQIWGLAGLAVLMVGPGLFGSLLGLQSAYRLSLIAGSVFFSAMIVLICRDLLFYFRTVTGETLWAAINVYVLIGLLFAFLYALLASMIPNAFNGNIGSGGDDMQAFVYFSIVTLTTLGYGDITPNVAQAMTLAYIEALIGQLYVAILIARLVSMYAGGAAEDK